MRSMRRRVREDDVAHWAATFLGALEQATGQVPQRA
jgi:trehalose-6-phosphate synthase